MSLFPLPGENISHHHALDSPPEAHSAPDWGTTESFEGIPVAAVLADLAGEGGLAGKDPVGKEAGTVADPVAEGNFRPSIKNTGVVTRWKVRYA